MPGKGSKIIEEKYKDSVRRLSAYWPQEFPTLTQLEEGKKSIRLASGATHEFDPGEVERLLELVPSYFKDFMKVPVLFRYEKIGGRARYRVLGDYWQRRLVELMLTGDYSYEGVEELSVDEFIALLSRYKSLVFVTILY